MWSRQELRSRLTAMYNEINNLLSDRSQAKILLKLNLFQEAMAAIEKQQLADEKNPREATHQRLTFMGGYCTGFAITWVSKIHKGEEEAFYDLLKRVMHCPLQQMTQPEHAKDFEELGSCLEAAQKLANYLYGEKTKTSLEVQIDAELLYTFDPYQKDNLEKYPQNVSKVIASKPTFSDQELADFLALAINENMRILIGGYSKTIKMPGHLAALYRRGEIFEFYEGNYMNGRAKQFSNTLKVVKALKESFSMFSPNDLYLQFQAFHNPPHDLARFNNDLYQKYKDDLFLKKEGFHRFFAAKDRWQGSDEDYFYYVYFINRDMEHASELLKRKNLKLNEPLSESKLQELTRLRGSERSYFAQVQVATNLPSLSLLKPGNTLLQNLCSMPNDPNLAIQAIQNSNEDINFKNKEGQTALHTAANLNQAGTGTLISSLLEKGADPLAKDKYKMTPLDYALHKMNSEALVLMLLKLPKGALDLETDRRIVTIEQHIRSLARYFIDSYLPTLKPDKQLELLGEIQDTKSESVSSLLVELFKKAQRTETHDSYSFFQKGDREWIGQTVSDRIKQLNAASLSLK